MQRIVIQSDIMLPFPPYHRGFVEMEIDLIQNLPNEEKYELRIVDRCFILEPQDDAEISKKKYIGNPQTRFSTISYEDIKNLLSEIQMEINDRLSPELINKVFQKGLLKITQKECEKGITWYNSQANNWIIPNELQ